MYIYVQNKVKIKELMATLKCENYVSHLYDDSNVYQLKSNLNIPSVCRQNLFDVCVFRFMYIYEGKPFVHLYIR